MSIGTRVGHAYRVSAGTGCGQAALAACVCLAVTSGTAVAQVPLLHHGEVVPRDVREMYDRRFAVSGRQADRKRRLDRRPKRAGHDRDGPDGLYGVGRGPELRALPEQCAAGTAQHHLGPGRLHWIPGLQHVPSRFRDACPGRGLRGGRRSRPLARRGHPVLRVGVEPALDRRALELAVRTAVTSQKKNPQHAWRYSPDANDADTSVSGAVLVGLLAARNAGIEVPDTSIDNAIAYYKSMTSNSGQVAYSGIGGFD